MTAHARPPEPGWSWVRDSLHFVYFWLGLYGNNGFPSHSRILSTLVFLVTLVFLGVFDARATGPTTALIVFNSMVVAAGFGARVFMGWLEHEGPGVAKALQADMSGTAKAWPDGQEPI